MNERILGHLWPNFIGLSFLFIVLCVVIVYQVVHLPHTIKVKACPCGAHWWVRKWGFWRHLDASPFNDKLQDLWSIWFFEFRTVLKLTVKDQAKMGYPQGPIWEDGKPMWAKSKWQLKLKYTAYCLRCVRRSFDQQV